jgi:hypothetical protein
MTLRFDQKLHQDGPEFLCIGDAAFRKEDVSGVLVIDGKLTDRVVEVVFVVNGQQHRHRLVSAAQVNGLLRSLGLEYTPNADDDDNQGMSPV